MSLKACAEPGCSNLTTDTNCAACRREKRQPSDRKRAHTRSDYGQTRWRMVRRQYLKHHPLCECGCGRLAIIVHHLDAQGLKGPRADDPENLEALSKPCHDRLTAREQPAGWNDR